MLSYIRDRSTYEFWHLRRGCSEPSEQQECSLLCLASIGRDFFMRQRRELGGCGCSPFYSLNQGRDSPSLFPLHRQHLNCTAPWSALPKAFVRELPPGAVSPVPSGRAWRLLSRSCQRRESSPPLLLGLCPQATVA